MSQSLNLSSKRPNLMLWTSARHPTTHLDIRSNLALEQLLSFSRPHPTGYNQTRKDHKKRTRLPHQKVKSINKHLSLRETLLIKEAMKLRIHRTRRLLRYQWLNLTLRSFSTNTRQKSKNFSNQSLTSNSCPRTLPQSRSLLSITLIMAIFSSGSHSTVQTVPSRLSILRCRCTPKCWRWKLPISSLDRSSRETVRKTWLATWRRQTEWSTAEIARIASSLLLLAIMTAAVVLKNHKCCLSHILTSIEANWPWLGGNPSRAKLNRCTWTQLPMKW